MCLGLSWTTGAGLENENTEKGIVELVMEKSSEALSTGECC